MTRIDDIRADQVTNPASLAGFVSVIDATSNSCAFCRNRLHAAELTTHGQPAGTPNRRALVIAGDDAAAKRAVADVIDRFGFDVVDAGPLKEGWRIQRDTPGSGPRRTAEELTRDLALAKRYRDMVPMT